MAIVLYIERKYRWQFRGHTFSYRKTWPRAWLHHLEGLPHQKNTVEDYPYYVFNDPYREKLENLFEDVIDMVEEHIELPEIADELELILSFVQCLEYYRERGDYPRYPMETLIDKGGDCEDTAILMAAMTLSLGYKCSFLRFSSDGFLGFGQWGHIDLGVAANFDGEFSGRYWKTHDGIKNYFMHCNSMGWKVGEYSGKWGNRAAIYPVV